ncbi:MAG: hypothetical protein HQ557_09745 [Bacteroidetes bacterium]|nr:hypothetical protein [Bacteroidota bacterium]
MFFFLLAHNLLYQRILYLYSKITYIFEKSLNLTSQKDSFWNETKTTSTAVDCITIEVPRDQKINRVIYCSPDIDNGEAKEMPFQKVAGVRGPSIQFEIHDLKIWGVVGIE